MNQSFPHFAEALVELVPARWPGQDPAGATIPRDHRASGARTGAGRLAAGAWRPAARAGAMLAVPGLRARLTAEVHHYRQLKITLVCGW